MAFDVICKFIGFFKGLAIAQSEIRGIDPQRDVIDFPSPIALPEWTFTYMFVHLTFQEQGPVYFIPDKGHQWEMSTRTPEPYAVREIPTLVMKSIRPWDINIGF